MMCQIMKRDSVKIFVQFIQKEDQSVENVYEWVISYAKLLLQIPSNNNHTFKYGT